MSSVVGQSVGRSVAGLVGRPEKRVSFQSDSDVPKEEEVFPESFQDLQPQHVFGRHVHDHDVLADYVEHVVDLRLVGQVGSQLASMSELQEQDESWGAWRPPPAPTPPEVAPTTTPPLKKPRIPWAPREPAKEGPIVRRPHGESYHTKMASQPYMAQTYYQEIQAATQAQQQQGGQASQARAIPAPPPPPPPSASSSSRGPRPSAAPPAPVAAPLKPAPAVPKPTQAWQYNIPEPPPVPRSSRSDSRDP